MDMDILDLPGLKALQVTENENGDYRIMAETTSPPFSCAEWPWRTGDFWLNAIKIKHCGKPIRLRQWKMSKQFAKPRFDGTKSFSGLPFSSCRNILNLTTE